MESLFHFKKEKEKNPTECVPAFTLEKRKKKVASFFLISPGNRRVRHGIWRASPVALPVELGRRGRS
jgi:hypothetical protein